MFLVTNFDFPNWLNVRDTAHPLNPSGELPIWQVEFRTEEQDGRTRAVDVTGPNGAYVKGAPRRQPRFEDGDGYGSTFSNPLVGRFNVSHSPALPCCSWLAVNDEVDSTSSSSSLQYECTLSWAELLCEGERNLYLVYVDHDEGTAYHHVQVFLLVSPLRHFRWPWTGSPLVEYRKFGLFWKTFSAKARRWQTLTVLTGWGSWCHVRKATIAVFFIF